MPHNPHYGQHSFGDLAPKLAELTDETLFGDIWQRPGLTARERSLITVAALTALNRTEQLPFHFRRAHDNGIDRDTVVELITHLAFYAGWPSALSSLSVLRQVEGANSP